MREESVAQFLKRATETSEVDFAARHGFHFTTYDLTDAELWSALSRLPPSAMTLRSADSRGGPLSGASDLTTSGKSRAVNLRWILDRVTDVE
ncbi:MAG: hypothetical protein JSW71_08405 [Gemmatimonadota bacterium]|nr:MAG: hypothetical protein JSW71_08405 [Gemmatimonadota bacterium]